MIYSINQKSNMVKIYRGSKCYFLAGWHWIQIICYNTFCIHIL